MRTITRRTAAAVAGALLITGIGAAAASASTGNVVCNSSRSTVQLRVAYSTTSWVNLSPGQCSKSGAQSFGVYPSTYCVSPWGTVYDGPSWWQVLQYQRYTINANNALLTYTCKPA